VDERSALQKVNGHGRALARRLGRQIHQSFKADRTRRVAEAGEAIEAALTAGDSRESWNRLKAWYNQVSDRPSKPSRQDIRAITMERIDLYSHQHPPGAALPVLVAPAPVVDEIPTDEEIRAAVSRLRRSKSPGPSGIRTDHLKDWLAAAEARENPDTTRWDLLVRLLQHVYATGNIPTSLTYAVVVLLPKSDGGHRGIGLLEVIWKVLMSVIDVRMKTTITFHDALHGFRAKRGTGMAVFEAKLFQQLASIEQVLVFEVFLDLKKAYETP
jgi:hypothetical protein